MREKMGVPQKLTINTDEVEDYDSGAALTTDGMEQLEHTHTPASNT